MTTILHIDRSVYVIWQFLVSHQLVIQLFRGFAIPANNLQFHSFDSLHVAMPGSANVPVGM